MADTPPGEKLEQSVDEFDERLGKLDEQIDEATDKLHTATDAEPEEGPDAAEFPAGFDDEEA